MVVSDDSSPNDHEKLCAQTLTLNGMILGIFWYRIDVESNFEIRNKDTGKLVKKWQEQKTHKAYTFKEAGGEFPDLPGETFWMSYRYQLEAFVNKIRARETQHWVITQDSIAQMRMIDKAYEKSGLGPRPMSSLR